MNQSQSIHNRLNKIEQVLAPTEQKMIWLEDGQRPEDFPDHGNITFIRWADHTDEVKEAKI